MQYYNYEMRAYMCGSTDNLPLHNTLQKYFPENHEWGVNVLFDNVKNADTIEICRLSDYKVIGRVAGSSGRESETWTHYATIGWSSEHGKWEVYSQFNGKNKDELWIFAYYEKFGDAVRRVKLGIEKLKPIKKY
jgi:hypothetical protein